MTLDELRAFFSVEGATFERDVRNHDLEWYESEEATNQVRELLAEAERLNKHADWELQLRLTTETRIAELENRQLGLERELQAAQAENWSGIQARLQLEAENAKLRALVLNDEAFIAHASVATRVALTGKP